MSERTEALMRIVIGIVTGIILGLWKAAAQIAAIINFVIVLITGKRNKGIAEFCEMWNTQCYIFIRYMVFLTNERPFPFTKMEKSMSVFQR